MPNSPNADIPFVPEGTLDPAAGLNLSIVDIDVLLGCIHRGVLDVGQNDPPGSPSEGDPGDGALYVVGIGTGDWAGQDNNVARYDSASDTWSFYEAGTVVGMVRNLADGLIYTWRGSDGWVSYPSS